MNLSVAGRENRWLYNINWRFVRAGIYGISIAIALGLVCCLYSNPVCFIDMSLIVESSSMEPTAFTLLAIPFSFSRGTDD